MPRPLSTYGVFLAALLLLATFTACHYGGGAEERGLQESAAAGERARPMAKRVAAPAYSLVAQDAMAEPAPAPPAPEGGRMVVKTASLDLEIEDYDDWIGLVQAKVEGYEGYIVDSSTRQARGNARRGHVQLRVPQGRFPAMLGELRDSARKVEGQQQGGEDVTEEFYDVEARLENNRRTERRFREILLDAKKVEDILAVERELARVRQTIERLEGRRRFLQDRVALATVTVNWHEPYPAVSTPGGDGFWSIVGEGFGRGLRDFAYTMRGVIAFAIGSVPLVAFIGFLGWLLLRWVRWRRGRSFL